MLSRAMVKRAYLLVTVLLAVSCDGQRPPTTPSAPSPSATAPVIRYVVSGTVRDDTGAPLPDARVFGGAFTSKGGPIFNTTTDAAGRYRGDLPAASYYQIAAQRAGYESQELPLPLMTDLMVDFTLHPGIMVYGKIVEAGVGPLEGAIVEIISGPNAGLKTTAGPPGVPGAYGLQHVLPGDFTLRASKPGYDPVERSVHALETVSSIDFTLKWAYGTCLRSVTPVLFDQYRSSGGQEQVLVDANPDRRWVVTPDVPWLQVSPEKHVGTARITFTVLPHEPPGRDFRRGALAIRCSESEGQNVWISQFAPCAVRLEPAADTPAVFAAAGGIGHLIVHTATAGCHWVTATTTEWIHGVGVQSWYGDLEVYFVVAPNPGSQTRTGTFTVGETVWTVEQR